MSILAQASSSTGGLRALSLIMGVFLIFMGIDKVGWLMDDAFLTGRLQEWLRTAPAASRWYLETVAIPAAPLFARLVPLGELAAGTALVCGFRVRLAADDGPAHGDELSLRERRPVPLQLPDERLRPARHGRLARAGDRRRSTAVQPVEVKPRSVGMKSQHLTVKTVAIVSFGTRRA